MLVKCQECGKEISDQATSCPNCGCPITTTEKPKKKKGSCIWILVIVVVLFLIFAAALGNSLNEEEKKESYTKEEFTTELDYRDCLVHPDDHIGDKVYCEVYIYDTTDGYCKANLKDDYSKNMFLHNKSDEKIVDGDYLKVYGVFNGNDATKNSLTGETGEIVALDVYYFDIIREDE